MEQIRSFSLEGIPISLYRSNSGMRVYHCRCGGPLVKGFFAVATEASDHDGLPHTLEHLVFLGSEVYPFKGVLDLLANRSLAQGTNAWTDTDHTAYTLTTAGSQGFLSLLPVFLDHILYPTITDEGFVTEVYHVNEKGDDAGVVYCEMQARENTGSSKCWRATVETLYPGTCSYRWETGGMMANLRDLTVEKVRAYHQHFYRPSNLALVVCGDIEAPELLHAIEAFEKERVAAHPASSPIQRPFSAPLPAFTESTTLDVPFADDEEATGHVFMAWRSVPLLDIKERLARHCLWTYLSDSAIAPLQEALVECDEPLCSDIDFHELEHKETSVIVIFSDVPADAVDEFPSAATEAMQEVIEDGIDMERMRAIVQRERLRRRMDAEEDPHDAAATQCIADFLYDSLEASCRATEVLRELETATEESWIALLKRAVLDAPCVTVRGRPSRSAGEEQRAEEEKRLAARRAALGEEGLRAHGERVAAAKKTNELPPPDDLLTKFSVPDAGAISRFAVDAARGSAMTAAPSLARGKAAAASGDLDALPCRVQIDHEADTAFVTAVAYMDTKGLSDDLRALLEVYLDVAYELPVRVGDKLVPHDDVVRQLDELTVSYSNGVGAAGGSNFRCGSFAQLARFEIKAEYANARAALELLRNILWHSVFTADRVRVAAQRLLNETHSHKRSGSSVAAALVQQASLLSSANIVQCAALRQGAVLERIVAQLDGEDGGQSLLAQLDRLRSALLHPAALVVHVSTDVEKLGVSAASLLHESFFGALAGEGESVGPAVGDGGIAGDRSSRHLAAVGDGGVHRIVGLAALESSFLARTVRGIDRFDDADYAPSLVLAEYLTAMEGLFWREIRGLGLAYSYGVSLSVERGVMSFTLYRSGHLAAAFAKATELFQRATAGEEAISQTDLEAAICSTVFSLVEREDTRHAAAHESLVNYYRHAAADYTSSLCAAVQRVSVDDLLRVGKKYFAPLFAPGGPAITAAAVPPNKVDDTIAQFSEQGIPLAHVASLDGVFSM